MAPEVRITSNHPAPNRVGEPIELSFEWRDEDGNASSATVTWESGVEESLPLAGTGGTETVSHTYETTGTKTITVRIVDTEGKQGSAETTLESTGITEIDVQALHYFGRDANPNASLIIEHATYGFVDTLRADPEGRITGIVVQGRLRILPTDPVNWQLHALRVDGACRISDDAREPVEYEPRDTLRGVLATVNREFDKVMFWEQYVGNADDVVPVMPEGPFVYTLEAFDEPFQSEGIRPEREAHIIRYWNEVNAVADRADFCGGRVTDGVEFVKASAEELKPGGDYIAGVSSSTGFAIPQRSVTFLYNMDGSETTGVPRPELVEGIWYAPFTTTTSNVSDVTNLWSEDARFAGLMGESNTPACTWNGNFHINEMPAHCGSAGTAITSTWRGDEWALQVFDDFAYTKVRQQGENMVVHRPN